MGRHTAPAGGVRRIPVATGRYAGHRRGRPLRLRDRFTISATDCDTTTTSVIDLCFTTTNYHTPQAVTVSAAQDTGGAAGTAIITHTATGANYAGITGTVIATEIDDDNCHNSTATPASSSAGLVADCGVLLAAKDQLRGTGTLDWSKNTAITSWEGVTITGGRVTGLNLTSKLNGSIPASLGSLAELTTLNLSSNWFRGSIPAALGNLTKLTSLDLSNNYYLTGAIPTTLGNLTKLTILDLSGNNRLT